MVLMHFIIEGILLSLCCALGFICLKLTAERDSLNRKIKDDERLKNYFKDDNE